MSDTPNISPQEAEKICSIDQNDVLGECAKQAAYFAYWSSQLSDAELKLEKLESSLDSHIRSETSGKQTETAIKRAMAESNDWMKLSEEVGRLKAVVGGFDQRYGMLKILGQEALHDPREEMQLTQSEILKRRSNKRQEME